MRRNPLASPIKEKRLGRFSPPDLFTDSEQCSFAVHPCTANYRILRCKMRGCFAKVRHDIRAVRCNEREARSSPRRIYVRLLSQSARKRRALCPHKELQSAFISFIASERMRYESLRTDKRKTAQPFFNSRLPIRLRAVRSNLRASPIKEKCHKAFFTSRLPIGLRAVRDLATSAEREVPRAAIAERLR